MQLHQTQSLVAKDNHKYRTVCCGRQWGKTTLSVWEMFGCAYASKDKRIGYFAPTFIQARDIAWKMLKEITSPFWAKDPNETRLEIYIKTQDGGISEIVLKGWESIESVRGTQFDFVVLDEVAKMRNFKEGYEAALGGSLVKRQANVLFISTPYGYNHFYDLFQSQERDPNYQSFHFTSYDNPHLPVSELDIVKNTTTPDFFAQEYLAQFTRFTGLVYKEFDIAKHVQAFDHQYNQNGDYYFGQDFAVRTFNAAVPLRVDSEGTLWILDNYKKEGFTAEEHGESIKKMLTTYASLERYVGYGDPAGWSDNLGWITTQKRSAKEMRWNIADEFIESGLPLVAANNEVTPGINYVKQLFLKDKIRIHPRCQQLIDELLQYQWKDQPSTQVGIQTLPEEVRKINDHLVDALRYVCYSKPSPADQVEEKRATVFPINFPPPRIEEDNPNQDRFTEIDNITIYD